MSKPGKIDARLVNAQQARRILDRLVGYKASPILWQSIKTGLSAGRVQTVALRLIVERERDIRAFKPQEYWSVAAECAKGTQVFEAELKKIDGHNPHLTNETDAKAVVADLNKLPFVVTKVEKRNRKKRPGRSLHDQYGAAGSGEEAGVLGPPHHARRPGSLRGHGDRRGCPDRPHHLHADRLGAGIRRRHRERPRVHPEELRQALPAGDAQSVHLQGGAGSGRARGHPAHRCAPPPGGHAEVPGAGPVPALSAHLAAVRRVADEPGDLRHDHRGLRSGQVPAAGNRIGDDLRRLPCALHRRPRGGGGEERRGPLAHPAARSRRSRWKSGASRRASISPSRRRGFRRPAW